MKSHPFDAVSMVFGVIFAGIGALFLMGNDVGDLVTRFWPAAVVMLGLAMLFSARREEAPAVTYQPNLQAWCPPTPAPVAPVRPAEAAGPAPGVAEPIVPPVVAPPAQLPEAEVTLEESSSPKPAE